MRKRFNVEMCLEDMCEAKVSRSDQTCSFDLPFDSLKRINDLCETIAHYWIVKDFEHVLSSQYCQSILESLVKLFPLEEKVKKNTLVYFFRNTTLTPAKI